MADSTVLAARALRRLLDAFVAHESGDGADLQALAADATRWTTLLERQPRRQRDMEAFRHDVLGDVVVEGSAVTSHYERCPVCGPANPVASGMTVRRDGEDVVCEVVLGAAYEGAPGRAHGGVVAALCDDATAYLGRVHGLVFFAGELCVRYVRPTPVGVPLTIRARITGREGRRVFTTATVQHGDEVVADATCIKVLLRTD